MKRFRTAAVAALAGALLAPAAASAQFPLYGKDKWLGNVNEFTNPLFTRYFNQLIARERRQVGQRRRDDAHRGDALDGARPGLQLRQDQRR